MINQGTLGRSAVSWGEGEGQGLDILAFVYVFFLTQDESSHEDQDGGSIQGKERLRL